MTWHATPRMTSDKRLADPTPPAPMMPTFMSDLLSHCVEMEKKSGGKDTECVFRVHRGLRAAHQKNCRASYERGNRCSHEHVRKRQMQREHDAAKDRADDRSDAPDPQRPPHAGRADIGRIKRCCQRIRSGLSANHARTGKKSTNHDGSDGMGKAERSNEN